MRSRFYGYLHSLTINGDPPPHSEDITGHPSAPVPSLGTSALTWSEARCYHAFRCGLWMEASMTVDLAFVPIQIPLPFTTPHPRPSQPSQQSNCKSIAWYRSGRYVNFTFLMTLANTLKHTNWNCSVSVSTGRILTTGLKGQSIGNSPGEALMPGNRLTVN